MNISFNFISNHTISFLTEKTLSSLTALQKRILVIASFIFGCIAAYYALRHCFKRSEIKPIDKSVTAKGKTEEGALEEPSIDLNSIERREWLNDRGSAGNINFSVISVYKGPITHQILEKALRILSQSHPLLRTTIKIEDQIPKFHELKDLNIPLEENTYTGLEQWREIAKRDLRQRFDKDYQPLWRVSFLKGEQEGQILLTFHHAIADGVCGVEIMNHLYKVLSALLLNQKPELQFDSSLPPLENLYRLIKKDPIQTVDPSAKTLETLAVAPKQSFKHTNFVMHVLDESLTKKVVQWGHQQNIKVHSILFAAFLKAFRLVKNPSFDQLEALTVVNYRPFFDPPVSRELTRALFSWASGNFKVKKDTNFLNLAKGIHQDLHGKLKEGEHVANLKTTSKLLETNLTPQEFLQQNKMPPNLLAVTNVGAVNFDGSYPCKELLMKDIFFVANCDPYCDYKDNAVLSILSFQNRIYLALLFVEELFAEEDARAVLRELNQVLDKEIA